MKSGACPKCNGRDLLVIDEATVPRLDTGNLVGRAALASYYPKKTERQWFGDKIVRKDIGFSVYVCGGCSYSETYVRDVETLRAMASAGVASVRKLSP